MNGRIWVVECLVDGEWEGMYFYLNRADARVSAASWRSIGDKTRVRQYIRWKE